MLEWEQFRIKFELVRSEEAAVNAMNATVSFLGVASIFLTTVQERIAPSR